jgi:tRNA dimethylallyltransferase
MSARLCAVVGPTCTGKTTLAVRVAELLAPAELVNADSRQVLRGLPTGTCAPGPDELRGVACHLVGIVEPGAPFTVAHWAAAATATVGDLAARGRAAIVVGGTGLYITALEEGFDFGGAPPSARRREREAAATTAAGLHRLAAELRSRDPLGAAGVDLRNPRRVVRALDLLDAHPEGLAQARGRPRPLPLVKIGLDLAPQLHQEWVRRRTAAMFRSGAILDEVRAARARGVPDEVLVRSGIGFREALEVVDHRSATGEAIESTVRRTLRYARAQRSYWRRDEAITWFDATSADAAAVAQRLSRGWAPRADDHATADLPAL